MRRVLSRARARLRLALSGVATAHPNGHFYSPVCDPQSLVRARDAIWPTPPPLPSGIDFNDASHIDVLERCFPLFHADFDYPETGVDDGRLASYYRGNSQFGGLDARALFVLMRALRPRRIIEVGSGYSSLLMADVNQRFLDGQTWISCIEPYPREFLERGVPGIAEVIRERVQDVPLTHFDVLQAGDVLFIDSSHVSKTGSDVNHLYFEVLPRLAAGVIVHVHDIFLPEDYPQDWAIGENRSWNEQYLLRALLMYSTAFQPIFGSHYAWLHHRERNARALGLPCGSALSGGSFWMRRV